MSPLKSDRLSRRGGFRIWKNASESGRTTLEVSAIASISDIRNTPRTASREPPLYQFDLFVAGKKVLLHYCFVDRRRAYLGGEQLLSAPPKRDSRRGMFFAGSAPATPKTLEALKARSLQTSPPMRGAFQMRLPMMRLLTCWSWTSQRCWVLTSLICRA